MRHSEHATERGSVTNLGSGVAPIVRINDVNASRQKPRSCGSRLVPPPRADSTSGDFRYFVDNLGFQHFNFRQRIWQKPLVQMAVTPVMTTALETLALNLLAYTTCEGGNSLVGVTSRRLLRLARRFCAECLLTASPEGWVIPRSTIEAWLISQQQIEIPAPSPNRARQRVQKTLFPGNKTRISYAKARSTVRHK
jgi:hypothetical protein